MGEAASGRLLVLTSGSLYAAVVLAPLLLARRAQVAGIGLSARPGPGRLATLRRVAQRAGWGYAAARTWSQVLLFLLAAAERAAGRPPVERRFWTMDELARVAGVAVHPVADVNSPAFLALLAQTGAAALVSVYFDQILAAATLERVPLGCYNAHPSLLPRHRGTSPVFWAMACGDAVAGMTLHRMAPAVDTGPIVAQSATGLRPGDALSAVYLRCSRLAGVLLVRLADRLANGAAPPTRPQPSEGASFHFAPTREAVRAFLGRGYRLV